MSNVHKNKKLRESGASVSKATYQLQSNPVVQLERMDHRLPYNTYRRPTNTYCDQYGSWNQQDRRQPNTLYNNSSTYERRDTYQNAFRSHYRIQNNIDLTKPKTSYKEDSSKQPQNNLLSVKDPRLQKQSNLVSSVNSNVNEIPTVPPSISSMIDILSPISETSISSCNNLIIDSSRESAACSEIHNFDVACIDTNSSYLRENSYDNKIEQQNVTHKKAEGIHTTIVIQTNENGSDKIIQNHNNGTDKNINSVDIKATNKKKINEADIVQVTLPVFLKNIVPTEEEIKTKALESNSNVEFNPKLHHEYLATIKKTSCNINSANENTNGLPEVTTEVSKVTNKAFPAKIRDRRKTISYVETPETRKKYKRSSSVERSKQSCCKQLPKTGIKTLNKNVDECGSLEQQNSRNIPIEKYKFHQHHRIHNRHSRSDSRPIELPTTYNSPKLGDPRLSGKKSSSDLQPLDIPTTAIAEKLEDPRLVGRKSSSDVHLSLLPKFSYKKNPNLLSLSINNSAHKVSGLNESSPNQRWQEVFQSTIDVKELKAKNVTRRKSVSHSRSRTPTRLNESNEKCTKDSNSSMKSNLIVKLVKNDLNKVTWMNATNGETTKMEVGNVTQKRKRVSTECKDNKNSASKKSKTVTTDHHKKKYFEVENKTNDTQTSTAISTDYKDDILNNQSKTLKSNTIKEIPKRASSPKKILSKNKKVEILQNILFHKTSTIEKFVSEHVEEYVAKQFETKTATKCYTPRKIKPKDIKIGLTRSILHHVLSDKHNKEKTKRQLDTRNVEKSRKEEHKKKAAKRRTSTRHSSKHVSKRQDSDASKNEKSSNSLMKTFLKEDINVPKVQHQDFAVQTDQHRISQSNFVMQTDLVEVFKKQLVDTVCQTENFNLNNNDSIVQNAATSTTQVGESTSQANDSPQHVLDDSQLDIIHYDDIVNRFAIYFMIRMEYLNAINQVRQDMKKRLTGMGIAENVSNEGFADSNAITNTMIKNTTILIWQYFRTRHILQFRWKQLLHDISKRLKTNYGCTVHLPKLLAFFNDIAIELKEQELTTFMKVFCTEIRVLWNDYSKSTSRRSKLPLMGSNSQLPVARNTNFQNGVRIPFQYVRTEMASNSSASSGMISTSSTDLHQVSRNTFHPPHGATVNGQASTAAPISPSESNLQHRGTIRQAAVQSGTNRVQNDVSAGRITMTVHQKTMYAAQVMAYIKIIKQHNMHMQQLEEQEKLARERHEREHAALLVPNQRYHSILHTPETNRPEQSTAMTSVISNITTNESYCMIPQATLVYTGESPQNMSSVENRQDTLNSNLRCLPSNLQPNVWNAPAQHISSSDQTYNELNSSMSLTSQLHSRLQQSATENQLIASRPREPPLTSPTISTTCELDGFTTHLAPRNTSAHESSNSTSTRSESGVNCDNVILTIMKEDVKQEDDVIEVKDCNHKNRKRADTNIIIDLTTNVETNRKLKIKDTRLLQDEEIVDVDSWFDTMMKEVVEVDDSIDYFTAKFEVKTEENNVFAGTIPVSAEELNANKICVCQGLAVLKCMCNRAYYCSDQCARSDWDMHILICTAIPE